MYTEGVAPSKRLPALTCPSKALPLQKRRSQEASRKTISASCQS